MIKIYKSEVELANLITNSTSIAYQHEIYPLDCDVADKEKVRAGLISWIESNRLPCLNTISSENDSDLHYVQSILVTTNWNKNDDVFDAQEVWHARHTPEHKPTNVGHDEHEIVGHMTANWVIDTDGKLIDDTTAVEDLPSLFHVVNGSVIYKAFQDEKLFSRAIRLIEEINAGRKYVSMECIFTGFDYAILTGDNASKIVARTDETSFLTKHLRAYGGSGIYNGLKIGRLLRNIVFTGKGFVDKPANPNSIIFDKNKYFDFIQANKQIYFSVNFDKSGVLSTNDKHNPEEENNMTDFIKEQNLELKAKNDELERQLAEVNEKLTKSSVATLESTIADLEEQVKLGNVAKENLQEQINEKASEIESIAKQLEEVTISHDKLKIELDKVKANELRTNRISILVDGGIDKEIAEKKVDLYSDLSEDQFNDLAAEFIEIAKVKNSVQISQTSESDDSTDQNEETSADEDVADEEIDEAEADVDTIDNVEETVDVDLSVAEDEVTEDDKRRVSLRKAIARLLNKEDPEEEN